MDGTETDAQAVRTRPPRRASGAWFALILAVIVIVPTVVALGFTTDDGAATPEGAVQQLADALVARDSRALLMALPPGERDAVASSVTPIISELERLGRVRSFDAAAVPGAEVHIDGLVTRSTNFDEERRDLAAVDVTGGTMRVTFRADHSPLTDAAHQDLADAGVSVADGEVTSVRDFSTEPLTLVTLREGGGWHVSPLYSLADAIGSRFGLARPRIGEAPDAAGADTPEAAVRDLVKAWADKDARRVVTVTDPAETRSLYDYSPLFIAPSQRNGRKNDDEGTFHASVHDVQFRFEGSGGTRKAHITALDASSGGLVSDTHVSYDGNCFRQEERWQGATKPFVESVTCDNDAEGSEKGAARPRTNPFSVLAIFGGGADLPTLTVEENQGRWFVSPIRSGLDSMLETLRGMQPDDLRGFVRNLDASARAAWEWSSGRTAATARSTAVGEVLATARAVTPEADRLLNACGAAALVDDSSSTGRVSNSPAVGSDELRARVKECLAQQVQVGAVAPDAVVWSA